MPRTLESERLRNKVRYQKDREKRLAADHARRLRDGDHLRAKQRARFNTLGGKYWAYKAGAVSRGLSFDLTLEQFSSLWQKPCEYCLSPIRTIGLDRIDNTAGYSLENVVPCCKECNTMRGTLTQPEFLQMCREVAAHVVKA